MIPKVSILVPVYNASNYIERCAHSLFQQTFEDIEYIFVNDSTPDDSIEKLQKTIEQYPCRKDNVKIINHETNKGASASRQTGIDNSTGNYILFVDNDDWINTDMIATMYKKAIEENADIVVCDYIVEKNNNSEYRMDYVSDNNRDYFRDMLENKLCVGYLWNKMIHRIFFELSDCRFNENLNIVDDFFALIRIYYYVKKCVKIDTAFYHYNKQNSYAQTASKTKIHYENVILFYELLEEFLKEKELYEKYINIVEFSKVSIKSELFIKTHSYQLRKQYAWLFREIEMKYISQLRFGEKLILFFSHYRMYFITRITQRLLVWKNRKNI